jgi:nicotinamide-nucleotide adenylyltransferase
MPGPLPDRGLFIGRFQPFHVGHLESVKRLAAQHDELVVGIGSANVSHTPTNPFTAGERMEMIRGALAEAGVANAVVVPIPDVGRNALWVSHVASLVPRFSVCHTNNPLPARLFSEAGYKVAPVPFYDRGTFEGTRIRGLLARDAKEWRALVPAAVARVILEVDGVARVRELAHPEGKVEGSEAGL